MTDEEKLERLVKVETQVCVKFEALKEAISLAKEQMDYRLKGMNEFQKRMDRLEGTFATKEELAQISRLVWIGFGIISAVALLLKFL